MNRSSRRAFLRDLACLGGSVAGLGVLGACAPAPNPAAPARMYRVGVLSGVGPAQGGFGGFWGRMAELGYVEGQNLIKEERVGTFAAGVFDELAAELVRLPVDVLVTASDPGPVRAAMAATTSIPIVMVNVDDPVGSGLVASLARPGANVTGVAGFRAELDPKRLQLLVEAAPGVSKVAAFGFAAEPDGSLVAAATTLGVGLLYLPVTTLDGYGPAVERAMAEGAEALLLIQVLAALPTGQLESLANQYRLPTMYYGAGRVRAGGLMTYVARGSDINRRAAEYVDRILRGAKPADLPVELPTRYELIVNMGTARALGLSFSRDFLAQVDEIIE
ncbi:MAG: transporter substrate binding protein [Chloroflexi bacterium]|nr:transporter substrate binding protein [Chloroflexota bacterium]